MTSAPWSWPASTITRDIDGDEWMAEVVLYDGTNLSDALVGAGLAVYWDGSGVRPGG